MSKIQEKINELLGTCKTLNIEDFSIEELSLLDEQIFLCDTCGWWCEVEEQSENNNCSDCEEE